MLSNIYKRHHPCSNDDAMGSVRLLTLFLLALLAGCPGEVPPRPGSSDASLDLADASMIDAPLDMADAGVPDAQITADAAITCVANGMPGVCMPTAQCSSAGGMSIAGFCPGPADFQCCVNIPSGSAETCSPAERPQPNAGITEEHGVEGCPSGMLRIHTASGSFCIDRFEASLELVGADGSSTPWSPYFNPGPQRVVARSLRGAVPQGYINGEQAKRACAEAGKRLCTDAEWQRACSGPDGTTYPYGATREAGVCNDSRSRHPAVELFGSVTNLDSPCINQLPDSVERTGAHTGCVTAEGAMDMMGNLHEWTADPAGTFRGGFYVDTVINGNGCRYVTTAHNTLHHDYSTGFRCCAD
jgi:formylglycine-generating enzyme